MSKGSMKDIFQTIDFQEIAKQQDEQHRLANISAYVLGRIEGERLDTALSILINSLEYLVRQLPEVDQNDARMKIVEFIDPKSYNRTKISELDSRMDDNTSSSGDK